MALPAGAAAARLRGAAGAGMAALLRGSCAARRRPGPGFRASPAEGAAPAASHPHGAGRAEPSRGRASPAARG